MSCAKQGVISYNDIDTIVSVTDACEKCGIIRWESSTDGINWTIIPNQTSQTLTVEPTNTLTYYRRGIVKAKDSCKDCKWRYSNIVEVLAETSISGLVWEDFNKNGLRANTDTPLSGVVINIWNEAYDTIVQTTISDIDGKYKVILPAGNYYIEPIFNLHAYTLENVGSDETIDSDFDNQDTFGLFTLVENQKLTYDVGMYKIPDYQLLTTRNLTINGVTIVNKVINVSELNNVLGSNPFKLLSQVNSRATINWNPTETILDLEPVNNSDWNYAGILEGTFHVWEYIPNGGIFPANGTSKIGITYTFNPGGNSGLTNVSIGIVQSNLESNYANNFATDIITFTAS